jgi:hypothetical protein
MWKRRVLFGKIISDSSSTDPTNPDLISSGSRSTTLKKIASLFRKHSKKRMAFSATSAQEIVVSQAHMYIDVPNSN